MDKSSLPTRLRRHAWLCVPLLCPLAARATTPVDAAPAAHDIQTLLYVSQPIGTHARRTYGLRLDRAYAPPVLPNSIPLGPMHRRELLNVTLLPAAKWQVEFAGRLAWILREHRLSIVHH